MTLTKCLLASVSLLFLVIQPVLSMNNEDDSPGRRGVGPSSPKTVPKTSSWWDVFCFFQSKSEPSESARPSLTTARVPVVALDEDQTEITYIPQEGWTLSEFSHWGRVFKHTEVLFFQETHSNGGRRSFPKKPKELTPATIECLTSQAIVHFKHYEIIPASEGSLQSCIRSFSITPNLGALTATSDSLPPVLTDPIYGSISVLFDRSASNLDLRVFYESSVQPKDSPSRQERYSETIASALYEILDGVVLTAYRQGYLSALTTVTIFDKDVNIIRALAKICSGKSDTLFYDTEKKGEIYERGDWKIIINLKALREKL